jgi:membrane-associated phospholipid phosphatase
MARFNRLPFRRYDRQVAEWVNTHVDRRYRVDDYLQPAVALFAFGADFIPGVRSEHNLRDRTLLVATSCALTGITVTGMKHTIFVRRPNGSNLSFPSGHTALAFTGAHLLYREYRNQSPWIGIGGYAAATAVGVLRVVNRKHWVSDVVTGAGIGILSVEAAGLMLPVWHRLLGINGAERVVIMPAASINQLEVSLVCRF